MVVSVIKYGSPVLRKNSSDVTSEDNPTQIATNLFDTLKKEGGLGLAGPQIGILKRIFIIDTTLLANDDPSVGETKEVIINPTIIEKSNGTIIYNEGCLSIPGIYKDIERPEKIRARYFDLSFNAVEKELDGLPARIFQHEFDHLEGILFIDKLSPLQRKLLKSKLDKIRKQK